jgi:hypothetical protein
MKKLMMIAVAACAVGCSVKKFEYTKNDKGEVSYRIYENDHWLKTESTGIKGGMTGDGQFVFEAEGMKSSPSEEFNRTMQTYTTAFVQLAQIAAAAYNPSASQAVSSAAKSTSATTTPTVVVNTQQAEASAAAASKEKEAAASPAAASAQTAAECKDCTDPQAAAECTDCTVSSDAARTSAK